MRAVAIDFAAGAIAFALSAAVLLLQSVTMTTVEYGVIVLPAIVFPVAALIRSRKSNGFAIILWCVAAFAGLAWVANARWTTVVAPFAICLVGIVVAVFAKRLIAIVAIVAICVIAALMVPAVWGNMLTRRVQFAAPDVVLHTSTSTTALRQLRGSVVVLNFWGVWCGPCVRELPELNEAAKTENAKFFAVNSAIGGETLAQIGAFVRARNVTVPVAYDPDRSVYKSFRVSALPTTVVIDRTGVVRVERVGYVEVAKYDSWLRRAIRDAGSS